MPLTTHKLIIDFGCKDISDAMRLDMLVLELKRKNHTLDSIKKSSAFTCAFMNFNFTDDYLLELINLSNENGT